jgi:hypothetical protein
MTTKEDVRRLLSKGLTGKEAGKLVLRDNWLVDHGKEGFLTDRDLSSIKNSLKTTKDIQEYNSYIESYRLLDYTLKQATITRLLAEKFLLQAGEILQHAVIGAISEHSESMLRPSVMTEKQYQEAKTDQRARFMEETFTLYEVISWRLLEKYPGYCDSEEGTIEPDLEYLVKEEPDKLREGLQDILQLLKSGKLQPSVISEAYIKKLKAKEKETKYPIPQTDFIRPESHDELVEALFKDRILTDEELDEWNGKIAEEDQLKVEAYKAGKRDQKRLIATLEGLIEGSIEADKAGELLDWTYSTGEDLYKAGLPEFIEWIDTFKTSYFGGDGTLGGIAILQDPKPEQIDKRGYYKEQAPYLTVMDLLNESEFNDFFPLKYKDTINQIRAFLAFHSVAEAVSEVIGIDFAEDTREDLKELTATIESYNKGVELARHYAIPERLSTEIKHVDLDRYKPSAKTVRYLRERLALSLGDGWYEAKKALLDDLEEQEAKDGQD